MIRNLTRGSVLAAQPFWAVSLNWRLRGMIGRRFDGFDALVFPRCWSIHSWFMRIPIDVLFLDRDNTVVGVFADLQPWRTATVLRARTVIEFPADRLRQTPARIGDRCELTPPE